MKVKIYSTGYNNVRVKTSHLLGGFPNTRRNTASDSNEWPSIIENYGTAEAHINDFEVAEESIDHFYNFANKYYGELTKEAVEDWWNHDCPDLFRYYPNKENGENHWGLNLMSFKNKMLEVHFKDTYVQEITEEEADKLIKGREDTLIAKEIKAYFKSDELDEETIKHYEEEIEYYESRIEMLFDRYKEEMIEELDGKSFTVTEDGIDFGPFRMDCGFLNIYTKNEKITEMKKVLSNKDHSKWLSVRLPVSPQSINIKRDIFNYLAGKVKEEIGEELYCTTMLD